MEKQNNRILPTEKLSVTAVTSPFGIAHTTHFLEAGETVADILQKTCPDLIRYKPNVFIGDWQIDKRYYSSVRPKPGQIISIRVVPHGGGGGGGKNPLNTILSIALVAVAPQLSGFLLQGTLFATPAQGLLAGALLRSAITFAGRLLINAIAPPAAPQAQRFEQGRGGGADSGSETYFIQGARNRLKPFEPIPVVLGKHRIVPPLATQNYNEVAGDDIFVRQMFCIGHGKHVITEEKIGETLLTEFQDFEVENFFDGNSTDESLIIPGIVTQNNLNIQITGAEPNAGFGEFFSQTTSEGINEFEVQITFSGGLTQFIDGNRRPKSSSYEIRYAPTGTEDWISQTYLLSRDTANTFAVAHRFQVDSGQYDVEIRNLNSDATDNPQVRERLIWSSLRSYINENPVKKDGLSLKAVRIRGNEQLNGAIDEFNCIASQLIEEWNGSEWVADQETSNPASIFYFILKSNIAKSPIPDTEIDLQSIYDWHEYCEQEGFEYNAYIDYSADRESLLKEVAAAGLAAPTIIDNKYSVIVDKQKDTIIQHISQRNSFNYNYEKIFSESPHALRVPFLNRDKGYFQDEIIVYDDGYDETNATKFEQLDFPGVVDSNHIYKLARHRIAEARLRPDMHSVTMDPENLVATRGDRVKFSHDVAFIGLGSGRVKSLITDESGNTLGFVSDQEFTTIAGTAYSVEVRGADGSTIAIGLNAGSATSSTINFLTPVPTISGPQVGDLFSFGETDSVTIDAIIQSIEPQSDLTAVVKLVDYAPGVFEASQGTIPSYDNKITLPPEFQRPLPPELIDIQSDEFVQIKNIDGSISSRIVISLNNNNIFPVNAIVRYRDIEEDTFQIAPTTTLTPGLIVIEGLQQGRVYDFRVQYAKVGGILTAGQSVLSPILSINGHTFVGTTQAPPDVENFDISVRSESVRLTWDSVDVIDLAGYEIRFTPEISGATWQNGIPIDANIPKSSNSTTVFSAVGTYMIKAFDFEGNFSENAAFAVTTIGEILNLNVVKVLDDAPTWPGVKDGIDVSGGAIRLGGTDLIDDWSLIDDINLWDIGEGGIASGGIYYFDETVDLTEVYDCTISASLTVSGENIIDLVDEWDFIDNRTDWDGASPDKYSVIVQVRTTQSDPFSTPVWTEWRNLRPLGEYTARGFEFRLILSSTLSDVTPIVSQASITIDMPDRIEDQEDISSGTGGITVDFVEAFREPPTVVISADNLDSGDRVDGPKNITSTGFDIEFFNSSDVSVDKTFSYVAKGYGRAS